jgi:ubiquinone/menaquinone biosynthesis C-methylase UbiE
MSISEARATSFGQIADDYDRLRPGPPDKALDWLIPPDCVTAVDLAAGTGLFTRALRRRVTEVIAVEPDDRMRAVLAAKSPDVRAVAGRGEAIPLPDASADALFVASAWHWLDPDLAVPEIARVLRDGGRLAVNWTNHDHHLDWVSELSRPVGADPGGLLGPPRQVVDLPPDAPFENLTSVSFTLPRIMTVEDAVDWMETYSGLITASETERAAGRVRTREALLRRADADGMVEIPVRSTCWRADRLSRSAS